MGAGGSLWRLLSRVRGYPRLAPAAALLSLATAAATLVVPWLGRGLFDRVAGTRSAADAKWAFLVLAALWVGSVLLGIARNVLTLRLGQRVIADLRGALATHLMRLPAAYFDSARAGDILARLSNDTEQFRRTLAEDVVGSLGHVALLLGGGALLLALDWRLTAALLLVAPAVYAGHAWLAPPLRRLSRAHLDAFSAAHARLGEAIANLRLVKSLGREPHEAALATRRLEDVYGSALRAGRFEAIVWGGAYGAFGLVALAVVWHGVERVLSGQLSLGTLLAYLYTLTVLADPLTSLAGVAARSQRAAAAADRVFEILDEPPEPDDPPAAPALRVARGEIVFDDVGFSYASGPRVLAGFSLVAPAGSTTALVGTSGAGKSTVIALLQRFYEPARGEIRIDGVPICRVVRRSLRASIAVVQQEALLFEGSIRDNIRYGRLDADDKAVEHAAAAAHVDEFARSLAAGLDTSVGERGVRLSGGQRQRIAIARAILRDAPILLLDEATSALDAHSESLVQDALRALTAGRTTLVVAHRLRTVQGADRIALLEAGRVAAVGTHEQLLHASEAYRRLQAVLAQSEHHSSHEG